MNRKYTTEQFNNSVDLLKHTFKDIILTTDVIVGFPGETEEEFNTTYKFLEKISFYKMHIFKYSQRKGTIASKMENQIEPSIKEKRSNLLIALSDKNTKKQNEQYVGDNVDVLFEEEDKGYIKGHTKNYILVKTKSNDLNIINQIKNVHIIEQNNNELIGNIKKIKKF